jgi:hypothetical protein
MKNNTIDFVKNELTKYFECKIIGSSLLSDLDQNLINDVDILVISSTEKIRIYLEDKGFRETQRPQQYKGYEGLPGSLIFINDKYDIPIHLCHGKNEIYSEHTILNDKFKRGNLSDLKQIINICENKIIKATCTK